MLEFLGAALNFLMPVFLVALVLGTALLAYAIKGTPRACAFPDCKMNHWGGSEFCSQHILDEYEEEHGRGSRPGDVDGQAGC